MTQTSNAIAASDAPDQSASQDFERLAASTSRPAPRSGLIESSEDADGCCFKYSTFDFIPVELHPGVLDGTNTTDLTDYFQDAHDAVPSGEAICVVGQNLINGTVDITKAHSWVVPGMPELSPAPTLCGAIVRTCAHGDPLFAITGTASRGVTFAGISFFEAHAAPELGWTPANYGWIFDCLDTFGDVNVIDCYAPGIRKLLKSVNSGRPRVERFSGQVFECLTDIDKCYDVARIVDVHEWPFWSSDASVIDWMVANKSLMRFGRCDTPFIDRVFGFAGDRFIDAQQVYYDATTAPLNPELWGTPDPYSLSNLNGGVMYAESFRHGLWVDCIAFSADIAVFKHLGDRVDNIPIAGGSSISLRKNDAKVNIGVFKANRLDQSAIYVAGSGCNLQLADAFFDDVNRSLGADCINVTGASLVSVGLFNIRNGYGATLGPALTPLYAINVAAQVNALQATGAATAGVVSLTAVGADTDIPVLIAAKNGGQVAIGGDGGSLQVIDGGIRVNATAVLVAQSIGYNPAAVIASVAAGASAAFDVAIPGSDATWVVDSIRHLGINGIGWVQSTVYHNTGDIWTVAFQNNTGSASSALSTGGLLATGKKLAA